MIEDMDRWLSRYASICHDIKEDADMQYPGTGAAGGMGYAFKTFTNATLKPGIDIVIEETRLEDYIQDADLVVTGEGMLDHQTAMGKAPIGVARLAKKYNKKVIAFAGAVKMDAEECNKNGIDAFFPIVRGITTLEEAMNPQNAKDNLTATAKQVMRLIMAYYC
jgi:glycerate kinase